MSIILFLSFIVIAIFDSRTILKNKDGRSHLLYSIFLGLGFILNLLLILERVPPSPTLYIERVVKLFVP